nr:MAG TPA: minor tail protein [Caudoviricetes sp.]
MQADGTVIIDTEIDTSGMKPGTKEVEAAVRRMANGIDDLGKKSEIAVQKQAAAFAKLNTQYAAQEQKVKKLQEELEAYAETKIPTQEYLEIQTQIEKTEQKLSALTERQEKFLDTGGKSNSSAYKKMQYDIDQLTNTLKYAQGELKYLEDSGSAFTLGKDTDKFAKMSDKYATEAEKLKQMNESLGASYSRVKNEFDEYKKRLLGVDDASKKAAKSTKKLGNQMDKSKKPAKKFGDALSGVIRRMVLFRLLRSAISAAFRSAKEGMENLAQYSPATNAAISMLLSQMTQLKNAFATAFSPILEAAAPALSKFIGLIIQAVNWTAQLAAALTGKDTYVKATAVEEDYGAALKDSNKELQKKDKLNKKILFSFDQLIQAQKDSDSSSNSYVGPTPDQMFKTEEVSNNVKLQADAIKKNLEGIFDPLKKSWEENGPVVAEAVKTAFGAIKQLAGDVSASFMQVWNTEGYGKRITDDLLITVANLVLTVAVLVTQFDRAWVSGDTGTSIIRNLCDILLIFTGFLREASESIKNWANDLDFTPLLTSFNAILSAIKPIAKTVTDALLALLNKALLPIAKWAVEQAIPAVFNLIAAALEALGAIIDALKPYAIWLWDDFLQPVGKWTGEVIISALKQITTWLKKFSDWISQNSGVVENMTQVIIAFFAAWAFVKFVTGITELIASIGRFAKALIVLMSTGIGPVVIALGSIITLIGTLARNWDKMTPKEKVISGILALAAAVGVLAVAMGAVAGGVGAVVVAGSIAAGVASALIAINAGKRASSSYGSYGGGSYSRYSAYQTPAVAASYSMPRLATGTVVPPRAGEFAAILGDNKHETEVVSPLSTMKQALKEALEETGMSGGNRDIHIDLVLNDQKFASAVYKANNQERQRVGVRMVTQNG